MWILNHHFPWYGAHCFCPYLTLLLVAFRSIATWAIFNCKNYTNEDPWFHLFCWTKFLSYFSKLTSQASKLLHLYLLKLERISHAHHEDIHKIRRLNLTQTLCDIGNFLRTEARSKELQCGIIFRKQSRTYQDRDALEASLGEYLRDAPYGLEVTCCWRVETFQSSILWTICAQIVVPMEELTGFMAFWWSRWKPRPKTSTPGGNRRMRVLTWRQTWNKFQFLHRGRTWLLEAPVGLTSTSFSHLLLKEKRLASKVSDPGLRKALSLCWTFCCFN